jgi:hypothetical protein
MGHKRLPRGEGLNSLAPVARDAALVFWRLDKDAEAQKKLAKAKANPPNRGPVVRFEYE